MSLKSVSEKQIIDRLKFENPWWVRKEIEDFYNEMPRRLYFDLFKPQVYETEIKRALILMGPRRVGKTVMLYHTVQDLIDSGIPPNRIIFITVESPVYFNIGLDEMLQYAIQAAGVDEASELFVFFDEIQYLKNWEVHLKSLVDSYKKCKFIASGSAAAALKYKSLESGAGRFTDFLLPPLTFNEYVHLKNLDTLIIPSKVQWKGSDKTFYSTTHIEELNRHFIDYLNFGGYPEVIFSEKIQANPGRFIRQDIIDKVLLRDLPSLYGIRDLQELYSLFTTIAYNTGNEFSLETLSKESGGVKKQTIKTYIEYLESAFLIKTVKRVGQNSKRFQRDNFFKIYLTNPSLRAALFSPLSATDDMIGNMVETAIYAQWMHRDWFTPWYARWQNGEVDMVSLSESNFRPIWALEVKWSNRYFEKPRGLKSLLKFSQENKLSNVLVTSIDKEGSQQLEGINLHFFPAATYAYTVGRNTLDMKGV
ncbi:MAG: ATP-binding protein [Reichenbachiella sp.]|uniref:ATP-binding protein n=1 Tax=Reichenbachiella sp. TaxID=2184521 RepID=UPI003267E6A3